MGKPMISELSTAAQDPQDGRQDGHVQRDPDHPHAFPAVFDFALAGGATRRTKAQSSSTACLGEMERARPVSGLIRKLHLG